jgi:hypothetical protein
MTPKERSINYFKEEINWFNPKPNVTNLTSPERKEMLIKEHIDNLEFVKAQSEEWFDKFAELANATVTRAKCGGHTKAELNEKEIYRIKQELKCEIPSDKILYSFGIFNGKGAI